MMNLVICLAIGLSLKSVSTQEEKGVVFKFPEFDYVPTSINENSFQEYEIACENSPRCDDYEGIDRVNCIRECVSPSCYRDIYSFDELEDGEVDVRLNSFKGCFIMRTKQ